MKKKYQNIGLNYDLIVDKFHNIDEYEEIVNTYLADEFFNDLKIMIENEDYEMVKDAVKGLYILAGDLLLYPLYEALLEMYEDLEYEFYPQLNPHYLEMMEIYQKIRGTFHV